jgi:NADH-quinone oxidoreductase subunit G
VRFSQEISEDYQLVLLERGAHSFVSTFDGHPYVAPFSGNIIELCPVGALTSRSYRFRARPWDIEDAGSVCTLCPAQCNVSLTVRDERVMRVLSRQNDDVDDGWLCDRGRFAYPALARGEDAAPAGARAAIEVLQVDPATSNGHAEHAADGDGASQSLVTPLGGAHGVRVGMRVSQPLLRDGGELRPVGWERALDEAAAMLKRSGAKTAALAGGGTTNEEGFLLSRLLRETLGSPHVDSRANGALALELQRELADPRLQATVSDLEFAHGVLVLDCDPLIDAPILDLRLRKGVRRHGMKLERLSGGDLDAMREAAMRLSAAGEELVILWGERFAAGAAGGERIRALLDLAEQLSLADTSGAGLLEVPATSNGRGLREAGVLPNCGPGLSDGEDDGLDSHAIAGALAAGELSALYLLQADPLDESDPFAAAAGSDAWAAALERASAIVAHTTLLSPGLAEHANVIFPAGPYAEKEGTVTHPDGRVQRVRRAVAEAGDTRPGWRTIAELSLRLGTDLDVYTDKEASQQLFDAVAFYAGLTLDEIGGRGVRWQEREAVAVAVAVGAGAATRSAAADGDGEAQDSAAQVTDDDSYTESARGEQTAPSAEAHSGPDRDTHAADTDTEPADSQAGEPPPAGGEST